MTNSGKQDVLEKLELLWEQTTEQGYMWARFRSDVNHLRLFILETYEPPSHQVNKALELFWSQYHPTRQEWCLRPWANTESPAERLSSGHEALMLDCLEWLYDRHRVPYQPDGDSWQVEDDLIVYLHIAAARAFRIKQSDGLSEEVESCLTEVERAWVRLKTERAVWPGYPAYGASTQAVSALAFVELGRVSRNRGDYTSALSHLAKAVRLYDETVWYNDYYDWESELAPDDLYNEDGSPTKLNYMESSLRDTLKSNLTDLQISLEEASKVFESIRADRHSVDDWRQVAEDCRILARAINVSGVEDEITDVRGDERTWTAFWHDAMGWATAQLSPSEYRKMREADERDAAENRLKNYFFGDAWSVLPQNAQERLITADVNWNSRQRMARHAILNDLLRATEEMCYEFISKPLGENKESSWDFLKFEARATDRHPSLTARDYVRLCEQGFFRTFLEQRNLEGKDARFLREDLPSLMRQLNDLRNPAEHETGSEFPLEEVVACYRRFLGIGQSGVLPELARIGRKLRGGRRGRR